MRNIVQLYPHTRVYVCVSCVYSCDSKNKKKNYNSCENLAAISKCIEKNKKILSQKALMISQSTNKQRIQIKNLDQSGSGTNSKKKSESHHHHSAEKDDNIIDDDDDKCENIIIINSVFAVVVFHLLII